MKRNGKDKQSKMVMKKRIGKKENGKRKRKGKENVKFFLLNYSPLKRESYRKNLLLLKFLKREEKSVEEFMPETEG